MNILVIAVAIDVMIPILPSPENVFAQTFQVLIGILLTGIASALYITCNVGSGPRDGLMTGLNEKTGIRIGRVRTGIEVGSSNHWLLAWRLGECRYVAICVTNRAERCNCLWT